jgi:hypothetical protein
MVRQAWDKGIVETRKLRPPIGQWRQTAYEEFLLRIACSMFSAYKYVAKNRQSKFFNKAALEVMQFQNLQTV